LKGIKGGNDEGGGKGFTASEVWSGGAEDSQPGSAGAVEKTGLTSEPPVSAVCREKAPRMKGVNQSRKRTSAITPMVRVGRAAWAGLWALACGRREANGGQLGQRPSGPVREEERFLN
jgi:hypothetical protein